MANHTTLVVIFYVVLLMARTTRCSWISGGAPPPVSEGDYVNLEDDDLIDASSPSVDDSLDQGKDGLSPGPSGDYLSLEKDEPAPGPDGSAASGGDEDFFIQEKEVLSSEVDKFIIRGKVYCDPCRIQFPTKISYPLPKTKVTLACNRMDIGEQTYKIEGLTDNKGRYTLNAIGDHAEEVCEITVSESPDPNCPELMDDENHVRVSLTNKHGIKGKGRFANPLGFMTPDADPRCKEALDELGFTGI